MQTLPGLLLKISHINWSLLLGCFPVFSDNVSRVHVQTCPMDESQRCPDTVKDLKPGGRLGLVTGHGILGRLDGHCHIQLVFVKAFLEVALKQ